LALNFEFVSKQRLSTELEDCYYIGIDQYFFQWDSIFNAFWIFCWFICVLNQNISFLVLYILCSIIFQ